MRVAASVLDRHIDLGSPKQPLPGETLRQVLFLYPFLVSAGRISTVSLLKKEKELYLQLIAIAKSFVRLRE